MAGAFEELGGGVTDFPGGFFVQWVGIDGADVVGFEKFFDHGVLKGVLSIVKAYDQ